MISQEKNGLIMVRLFPGEDLHEQLKNVSVKHGVESAVIVNGIGMLKEVELRYFRGKGDYQPTVFSDPLELVTLSGNISKQATGYYLHIHATLAFPDKRVVGGHLTKGIVNVTNEIILLKSEIHIIRRLEEITGIEGMYF